MSLIAQKLISASGPKEATDDDFNLVTQLYQFDGTNGAQNNTLLDSSPESHTVTRNADIVQGTFSPFSSDEGKWSVKFNGSTDMLRIPTNLSSDFALSSGDFTVEAFINVDTVSTTYKNIFSISYGFQFYVYNNLLHLAINDTDNTSGYLISANSGTGISANTWHHVAAYRDGNNFYCSIDGTVTSMGSSSGTIAATSDSSNYPGIGSFAYSTAQFPGYISNLRLIKGTALYGSSNFTAPSTALTAVTNTKLLTCCSNRFRDKSTSANTVTPAIGNHMTSSILPKVQPFSPFAPSSSYSAATKGGSGFFDQTSDCYFDVSDATDFDFGTGDYSVEMWVYPTTTFNTNWAMAFNTIGVNQYWAWTDGGGNEAAAGLSSYPSGNYSGSYNHMPNRFSWSHVVFQNTSGTENWYINGVRVYNATNNPSFSASATGVRVGLSPAYASMFFYGGYISDVRVLKGSNAYSNASTLTVPTAPLGSVTNTKLLTNFTNAAIFDQSGKTNSDTLGNAQLDTSVKKFGTASAEFDGTSDSLKLINVVPIRTSPFTLEFFFRSNTTSLDTYYRRMYKMAIVTGQSNEWCEICINHSSGSYGSGNNIFMYTPGNTITGTATPFDNNWHHFALTRDTSNNLKMFVDGTQDGSTVTGFTNDLTQTEHLVGANDTTGNGDFLGYIDELRLTMKARYTSNFTAPTKEFANR